MHLSQLFFLCFSLIAFLAKVHAQDPLRFQEEVDNLTATAVDIDSNQPLHLFTGSSSIRLWESLAQDFPEHQVLNRGFGGSHMSDLLHFADELILQYPCDQIFIYEGDNDIESGKKPKTVLNDAKKLVKKIRKKMPDVKIIFIAPKPSITRWHLKDNYQTTRELLKAYADKDDKMDFIDVWPLMLLPDGKLDESLFIEDGLHMNAKGYLIWANAIRPYVAAFK